MFERFNRVLSLAILASVLLASVDAFSAATKKIVVTGASGYLGREIVNTLINNEEGDEESKSVPDVICLVRGSRVEEETSYWKSKSSTINIKVMPYDMLDGGTSIQNALSSVFDGDGKEDSDASDIECCILHVASVFSLCDDHETMAHNNVKGAKDLMNAVANLSADQKDQVRVILTSSMAGVRAGGQIPLNGKYYTHEDWNGESQLGASWGASYQWSKAASEKVAWDIAKESGIQFTSLNPSFIFGPPSNRETSASFSIETVSKWIKGEGPVQSRLCVDVRDVARAHVLASQTDKTVNERIIISREARISSEIIAEELKKLAIELGIGEPDKIHPDTAFDGGLIKIGDREVACDERMVDLLDGFKCRPVEETMRDMAKVLLEIDRVEDEA
jgi:NADPH-dependent methylglyoxal reductase